MREKIGVGYASVTDIEKRYVLEALDSQRLSQGKFVAAFEKKFAKMHGHPYALCAIAVPARCIWHTLLFFKGDCIFFPADSAEVHLHGQAQFLDIRC